MEKEKGKSVFFHLKREKFRNKRTTAKLQKKSQKTNEVGRTTKKSPTRRKLSAICQISNMSISVK